MQGRYARTRANAALRPRAAAGALCFGVCARLSKSVAGEEVRLRCCRFAQQATTAESFGTKASRFVGGGGGGSLFGGESTPGPGHYESAIETTAPLVKRSFNITVGN